MDDVLDGSDVVLGVGGEGGQGGEDFCGLGDAFLYGGADEIDEGLFGVLSVEFFVLSGESFEEVEGKVGDAICGGFWGGVEGGILGDVEGVFCVADELGEFVVGGLEDDVEGLAVGWGCYAELDGVGLLRGDGELGELE